MPIASLGVRDRAEVSKDIHVTNFSSLKFSIRLRESIPLSASQSSSQINFSFCHFLDLASAFIYEVVHNLTSRKGKSIG